VNGCTHNAVVGYPHICHKFSLFYFSLMTE
jgi:hypothetical protein